MDRRTAQSAWKYAHTKVVATIGPASERRIGELIDAGISVARINFSHSTHEDHRRRIEAIRREARQRRRAVGILADIQGPKMRLGCFEAGWMDVALDETYRLREGSGEAASGEINFNLEGFQDSIEVGARIFLADAAVEMVVESREEDHCVGRVVRPGRIGDRKGVHLPDTDLHLELPTPKDTKDLELIRELGVDMIGVSFVSCADDVRRVRELVPGPMIVSKIERQLALDRIEEILEVSDGIMIARGDLGVEADLERLPLLQKRLIEAALKRGRFTITATEMLESMVTQSRPTRAEVADVANAVLDGSDAVMLSAETAMGEYPIESVEAMIRIARTIESSRRYQALPRIEFRDAEPTVPNAVAKAAVGVAKDLGLARIVCFTETGNTVRLLSRYRPSAEIVALTPLETTLNEMTILAHVRPIQIVREKSLEDMLAKASELLVVRGIVHRGEEVVFVAGVPPGKRRSTNVMKIHRIGERAKLA